MADAHKNFAYSVVATAPSPAASGTSLVVASGQGALFPAVPFNATIWPVDEQPTSDNAEIVRVTNIATDTFTITRAQESTAARTVLVGDQIAATITAKTLTDVETEAAAAALTATDTDITFTDNTTNDVSTTKHGFVPKAPNTTTQFLRGDAAWSTSGQIPFPAAQNASSDVNTLDDYEEGSWTPVLVGTGGQSGQVYSTQVGRYVKIGKLVHIQCRIILSTLGTITGSVQIGGLPFNADATASNYAALSVSYFQSLTTAVIWVGAHVEPGGTVATLTRTSSAVTTAAAFAQADLAATSGFIVAGSYIASA